MINTTLELYRASLADTSASLRRSVWAVAWLAISFGLRMIGGMLLGGFGFAGSLLLGLLEALLIGGYLWLIRQAVTGRRALGPGDLRDAMGKLFSETISVLFIFSIGRLILGSMAPAALIGAVPIASLMFNVAPEKIWAGRTTGTDLLADAWRFFQENWPEWLVPNLLAVGAVLAAFAGVGRLDVSSVFMASGMFGPFFGFFDLPWTLLGLYGLQLGAPLALGSAVLVHAFMLFRGHLYQRLASGSRRTRAWQARTRAQ